MVPPPITSSTASSSSSGPFASSSSSAYPSIPIPVIQATTDLVRALNNFGINSDLDQQPPPPQSARTSYSTSEAPALDREHPQQQDLQQDHEDEQQEEEDDLHVVVSLPKPQQPPRNTTQDLNESMKKLDLVPPHSSQTTPTPTPRSVKNLLRSTVHTIQLPGQSPSDSLETRYITSWKMADYAYKKDPCPFPTRARGLFTEPIKIPLPTTTTTTSPTLTRTFNELRDNREAYRIVVRGYDKFFNVGEVSWTEWNNLSKHSTAPYELTLKSNGCIIFISALSPLHILVTSKHAIGPRPTTDQGQGEEMAMSHSERGEYWLGQHLSKVGKTKEMLAKELWSNNWTAVAELCDDSFEEHVLAYPQHLTGLHLHGINYNLPQLVTLPSSFVTEFANDWGFIPTPYIIFPSVMAVKTYCETVQNDGGIPIGSSSSSSRNPFATGIASGNHQGKGDKIMPVEGFVVRGTKRGSSTSSSSSMINNSLPGRDAFFWKVKYDEPYLMYREWREITRKLLKAIEDEGPAGLEGVNPNKVKNEQTKLYLWWVKREIQKDVSKFESWKKGRGIIKTRDEFLKWREGDEARNVVKLLSKGKDSKGYAMMGQVENEGEDGVQDKPFDRWLIAPIAVQGCGKTALGLSLTNLFGFAHVQSDDFHMKKSGPHFLKAVKAALTNQKVVFADKNNHQIKLRSDLTSTALSLGPKHRVKLIALLYSIDSPTLPRDRLHALCASRIVERGEKHQTLRAGLLHESAIWQFLGQWQAFDPALNPGDGAFDLVIPMQAEWTREQAIQEVTKALYEAGVEGVPKPQVDEDRLKQAIEVARNWEPTLKKAIDEEKVKAEKVARKMEGGKIAPPRYYGVSVEIDLERLVDDRLTTEGCEVWQELKKQRRVEKNPHVTLVHEKEVEAEMPGKKEQWDQYASICNHVEPNPDDKNDHREIKVVVGPRIVWNSRVISIQVSSLIGHSSKDQGLVALDQTLDRQAHITIGTIRSDVRPIEGKLLLESWIKGERETEAGGPISCIDIAEVECTGRLNGLR